MIVWPHDGDRTHLGDEGRPSIPVLSVIRRVSDVIIGGTFPGRPVGEIKYLMTRFMMPSLSKVS